MKSFVSIISIGLTLLISGCAGTLTRGYEAEYQSSIMASTSVMEQLNFKQKEVSADGLKTTIEGYLNLDTPITIEVVFVASGWTQIDVRTGYVGIKNLEISKRVHSDIAKELKRLKPRTLKATDQKKKIKPTESKQRISQEHNEPLPSPKKSITTSATGINEDTKSFIDRQEKQPDKTEQHTSKASENEPVVQSPLTETVSAPMENNTDDTQQMRRPQEKQTLSHTESDNKTFTYEPKSELTIHSGSYGTINDVISYLEKNPSARVEIRAYTDSKRNIARNISLSRKRVSEIRNYLILNGISAERITAPGLKENNFPESNRTEPLGSLNHPVEMTIR